MARRKDRVAPHPAAGEWDFRFASNAAASGWAQVCAAAPRNARAAWEAITTDPPPAQPEDEALDDLRSALVDWASLKL